MTEICALCTGQHPTAECPSLDPTLRANLEGPVLLKPDRRSKLPQPPYEPCGTNAAAKRHRRNGEPVDEACEIAERLYQLPLQRAYRASKRAAAGPPRPPGRPRGTFLPDEDLVPCGDPSAARRHRRRGEPVDEACAKAEAEYLAPIRRRWRAKRRATP